MNTAQKIEFVSVNMPWWTLAKFAELVGWSTRKVNSKIDRTWIENKHYRYDPDGEIHINIEAYNEWINEGQGSKRGRKASKSGLTSTGSVAGKPSNATPAKLI